ncbi:hypothetical protein TRICI_001222 [Trichomonascus ciferrii]|uniref:Putative lipoate-protein ligase A n=1 Tax=Trichomonascus ciferrii TaxID=44093 RepID=A0A642VB85_9ASCO|nr:hypothetical protein TRICI_001222 [Trichomonascus ciferrii]
MNTRGKLYLSRLRDPFLNLSLEGYLFKQLPVGHRRFLLYVNEPCVVIGRNQNPWRECNVPLLNSLNIPLVRRRSGGGTVVHDTGNVNFSSMVPKEEFTRYEYSQMIVDALNGLPSRVQMVEPLHYAEETSIEGDSPLDFSNVGSSGGVPVWKNGPQCQLKLNDRHDVVTEEDEKKVSGSAFKIERQKAYHHGTMLLNSRLDVLSALLHRDVFRLGVIEGRGVESVKSPVANIGCDREVFIDTALDAYRQKHGYEDEELVIIEDEDLLPEEVIKEASTMKTWDWMYGQTPKFTHTLTHPETDLRVTFTVDKGIIETVDGLQADLQGVKYQGREIQKQIENPAIGAWLRDSIDAK